MSLKSPTGGVSINYCIVLYCIVLNYEICKTYKLLYYFNSTFKVFRFQHTFYVILIYICYLNSSNIEYFLQCSIKSSLFNTWVNSLLLFSHSPLCCYMHAIGTFILQCSLLQQQVSLWGSQHQYYSKLWVQDNSFFTKFSKPSQFNRS